eukprot:5901541-Pleurochrysis_carterae.AAC.1
MHCFPLWHLHGLCTCGALALRSGFLAPSAHGRRRPAAPPHRDPTRLLGRPVAWCRLAVRPSL